MASIEKLLENKFVQWCESIGGKATKGWAYMYKGIPDRVAYLPNGGGTVWVEFKGGTYYQLTGMQKEWREALINSNPNRYFVVDSRADLEYVISTCRRLMQHGKSITTYERLLIDKDDEI